MKTSPFDEREIFRQKNGKESARRGEGQASLSLFSLLFPLDETGIVPKPE